MIEVKGSVKRMVEDIDKRNNSLMAARKKAALDETYYACKQYHKAIFMITSKSKVVTQAYKDGWERIWGKKEVRE